jgi:hypothetical protein
MTSEQEKWVKWLGDTPHALGRMLGFKELTPLHGQWINDMWKSPKKINALMAARNSYKTSSVIITGIVRALLMRPNIHIGLIRKTYSTAGRVCRAIGNAFETEAVRQLYGRFYGVYPEFAERSESRLTLNLKNRLTQGRNLAPEANLQTYGIGSSITGDHLDIIVIDDIITMEDRVSAAEREKTKFYLQEVFANILKAKGKSKIIVTGTPWHIHDAWEYIIPQAGGVDKYPVDALPFMQTEDVAEARRRLSPALDAINYKLELIQDEGLIFTEPARGAWEAGKPPLIHVDAAYGGSDTNAITITDGKHVHGILREGTVAKYVTMINDTAVKFGARHGYCENNGDKGWLARDLNADSAARGLPVSWHTYHEYRNKIVKIQTELYPRWREIIVTPDTDTAYVEQILYWSAEGSGHDDAPDSAASALRLAERNESGNFNMSLLVEGGN